MTFGSQVKAVLFLAVPTAIVLVALLFLLVLFGTDAPSGARGHGVVTVVMAFVIVGIFLAGVIARLQIAALGVLRLLPWQGPELKVEEPRHLGSIFE